MSITAKGTVESAHTDLLAGGPGDLWVAARRQGIELWRGDAREGELSSPGVITELALAPGEPAVVLAAPFVHEVGSEGFSAPRVAPDDLGAGVRDLPPGARYRIERASFAGDPEILLVQARLALSRGRGAPGAGDAPGYRLMLFDARGGLVDSVEQADAGVQHLMLLPHWIVLGGATLTVVNRSSKQVIELAPLHAATLLATAFSADHQRFAVATMDGKVHLWRVASDGFRAAGSWQAHDGGGDMLAGRATALAFHPTRPLLASGGGAGRIHLWELGDEVPAAPVASTAITDPHGRPIHIKALAFTAGGATLRATQSHEQAIYTFAIDQSGDR